MLAKKGLLPLFYLGESGLIIKNRGRVTKLSWPFGAISQSNYIDTDHLQFMKFLKKMKSLQSIIWSNWKWNRIYFQQDIWKNRFTHPWWYLGIWYSYILRFFVSWKVSWWKSTAKWKKVFFRNYQRRWSVPWRIFFLFRFTFWAACLDLIVFAHQS